MLTGAENFHGYSLENALLTRPDLLQNLIHVLIRYRQYQYAVSANIEGIFLQVGVVSPAQLSFRFLWWEDPANEIAVYEYVCQIFGAKDPPKCIKYALKRNETHSGTTFPEAAFPVLNNFYIDDYLESSPTVWKITRKAQYIVKMWTKGGFTLTQVVSKVTVRYQLLTEKKTLPMISWRPDRPNTSLFMSWV